MNPCMLLNVMLRTDQISTNSASATRYVWASHLPWISSPFFCLEYLVFMCKEFLYLVFVTDFCLCSFTDRNMLTHTSTYMLKYWPIHILCSGRWCITPWLAFFRALLLSKLTYKACLRVGPSLGPRLQNQPQRGSLSVSHTGIYTPDESFLSC